MPTIAGVNTVADLGGFKVSRKPLVAYHNQLMSRCGILPVFRGLLSADKSMFSFRNTL